MFWFSFKTKDKTIDGRYGLSFCEKEIIVHDWKSFVLSVFDIEENRLIVTSDLRIYSRKP
jgi:hypothetical protein